MAVATFIAFHLRRYAIMKCLFFLLLYVENHAIPRLESRQNAAFLFLVFSLEKELVRWQNQQEMS